jgi:RNA polymerase sigma-70 factor (ECF subfamily)
MSGTSDASFSFVLAGAPARAGSGGAGARQLQQIREDVTNCYLRHRDAVFRFLLSNCRNPAEAEDLTHEAFLRLFMHYAAGEEIDSPLAWLLTVARNTMIDRGRQLRREAPQRQSVWARLTRTCRDTTPNAENVLMIEARSVVLERALSQLQGLEKDCLSLRLKGLSFREIADAMGIPMWCAVSHVNRAITKVRRRVKA